MCAWRLSCASLPLPLNAKVTLCTDGLTLASLPVVSLTHSPLPPKVTLVQKHPNRIFPWMALDFLPLSTVDTGLGESSWRGILGIVGCLAASLASIH